MDYNQQQQQQGGYYSNYGQQAAFSSNNMQFGFYDNQQNNGNNGGGYYNPATSTAASHRRSPTNSSPASAFQPVQPQSQTSNNNNNPNNYYAQQQPQMFMPSMDDASMGTMDTGGYSDDNTSPENEPPLLEELGINFSHIMAKTVAVLNPMGEPSSEILGDTDLAGPLIFCVAFGFCLLMAGKVSFGHIYLLAVMGCLSMYCLLNLMSQQGVALILTVSILGYCILPMVALSFFAAFISLQYVTSTSQNLSNTLSLFYFRSLFGHFLVIIVTIWCSMAASKLFSRSLAMLGQTALIAYPCFLVYGLFALLAVF